MVPAVAFVAAPANSDPPPASIARPLPGAAGSYITPPPPKSQPEQIDPGDRTVLSGTVSGLSIRVQPENHPKLPALADIEAAPMPIELVDNVWQPSPAGGPTVPLGSIRGVLSSAAVNACSRSVLDFFRAQKIDGVVARVVAPEPGQNAPMVVAVVVGTVSGVRTRAIAADGSQAIDDPRHARIAANSPLVKAPDNEAATLLQEQLIDDYLFQLNRLPGRQVSTDIVPGDLPGTVILDYLMQDRKMFQVQLQGSNTGTPENGRWIEQLGIIGTRLLNLDDVLEFRAATNTFDGVYSVDSAWEGRVGDLDQLRWRAEGDWSQYDASDVGIQGNNFTGVTAGGGGSLAWNFLQKSDLFLDFETGLRGWYSSVDQALGSRGESGFITPSWQVNLFRQTRDSVLSANIGIDWTGANGSTADLTTMGRINPSRQWWIMRGDAFYTGFLDNIMDPTAGGSIHQITLKGSFQWTLGQARPTPVSQNILGGFYTVRGYAQAASVGDNTVFGSVQYDFHLLRALPPSAPGEMFGQPFRWTTEAGTGMPPSWDLSPHVFFDAGYTSVNGSTPGELPDATLASVGIGITAMVGVDFSVTLDWGIALSSDPGLGVETGDSQLWFVGSISF